MLREVPLKTFPSYYKTAPTLEEPDGVKVPFDQSYARMLTNILEAPNRMANNIDGMRKNYKILDAVDTAVAAKASVVKLEEGLWAHLVAVMQAQEFLKPNRDLVAFEDDVKAARSVDPNATSSSAA